MFSTAFDAYVDLSFIGLYQAWVQLFGWLVWAAVALSVLVAVDRLVQVAKYCTMDARRRLFHTAPELCASQEPLPSDDDPSAWPRVAVQLPMFNERAVCQAIIDCACALTWPSSRLVVQVLDDSTDKVTRELVDDQAAAWRERGVHVQVLRRTNRQGYKAGALKEGMRLLSDVQYVAIFDADFRPEPDFLLATVPYLLGDVSVAFVQARWVFANPEESFLTKYVHYAAGSYFNFQGTAGVWQVAAMDAVGGWKSRTTVEDMDLSLRTYLAGYRAVFLPHVTVVNELPASFFAYRKQQHRWTTGPVQLWKRTAGDVLASPLPALRKAELLLCYFGLRKFATHWVSLGFFCTIVPLSVFTPEVHIPLWALVHLPVAVTATIALFTPRGWLFSVLYVLFENAMGLVKIGAVLAGLLDLDRADEWVVTTKLGTSDRRPGTGGPIMAVRTCRLYAGELLMATFVLAAAVYAALHAQRLSFSVFLLLQGASWGLGAPGATLLPLGCVFVSFAFNLVDGGGLLGFRLDRGTSSREAAIKEAAVPRKQLRVVVRKPSAPATLGAVRLGKGAVEAASHGRSASLWPLISASGSPPALAGWYKRGE